MRVSKTECDASGIGEIKVKVVSARDFQLKRENDYGTPEQNEVVKAIVRDIRSEGDRLARHTEQLDRVRLTADQLRVTEEELKAAYDHVEPSFVKAIQAPRKTYALSCEAEAEFLDGSSSRRRSWGRSFAR